MPIYRPNRSAPFFRYADARSYFAFGARAATINNIVFLTARRTEGRCFVDETGPGLLLNKQPGCSVATGGESKLPSGSPVRGNRGGVCAP